MTGGKVLDGLCADIAGGIGVLGDAKGATRLLCRLTTLGGVDSVGGRTFAGTWHG